MAASSEYVLGISDGRTSSRVLKPPGGGHSNIFAEPASELPKPRPKYNQQNSSNLNSCMNTVDPNEAVAKIVSEKSPTEHHPPSTINNNSVSAPTTNGVHQNGDCKPKPTLINVQKQSASVGPAPAPIAEKQITPTAATATSPTFSDQPAGHNSVRVRQPPGGYSSGLW